jgi:hypothetical protein
MLKRELKRGMIVQLNPWTVKNKAFAGCFMVVSESKEFGCQGYIQAIGQNREPGGRAHYRASWEEMELCGVAEWSVHQGEENNL